MKKLTIWINILITLMLIIPSLSFYSYNADAQPMEVWVDDDFGPGTPGWQHNHFSNIQEGIDIVAFNGTVFVYNGTYYENVVVNKTISLIGEDRHTTIIDGGGSDDVIHLISNKNTITEFTITQSGGHPHAGIKIISGFNYIHHNIFKDNSEEGIGLTTNSENNTIIDNIFYNNGGGGVNSFRSKNNTISNNQISDSHIGIDMFYSTNNTIYNNNISANPYGIWLHNYCKGNTFEENFISYNHHGGIWIQGGCDNNKILTNFIHSNGGGSWQQCNIFLDCGCNNNLFTGNTISSCLASGVYLNCTGCQNCDNNTFYHNNFINNTIQARDKNNDNWNKGYPFGGNYWSDYPGNDIYGGIYQDLQDCDGIGDIPYNITGGTNRDMYPLMHPYGSITNLDTGEIFLTIQDAIDNNDTLDGHTIYVKNGTYYENVIVNKTINLIGEDKNSTIVDDNGGGDIIYVSADRVNISGFHIKNSGDNGIRVESNYNNISHNIIGFNDECGIELSHSSNNIISFNHIHNNSQAECGISLDEYCNSNIISWNRIENQSIGIMFFISKNNTITENEILNNHDGILIQITCSENTINRNIIKNNFLGIYINGDNFPCDNNSIFHNTLMNNSHHAWDMRNNINFWDNGYPSGGNFWDDCDGWDIYQGPNQDIPGGDEISDTPYNITSDSNQDRYPLMHPYSASSNVYFQGLEPLYTTEYIEVAITITPKEAIAGAQLDMSFDPSMLSIEWVAEGDLFSEYDTYFDQGVIDNTNGTLRNVVSLITTPNGSTTNQGSIAIVAIRAKTIPGETPLNLSNVIVGGPDGAPIDVDIINTTVTIYHHDRWDVNWDDHANILDLIIIGQWWGEIGYPCWIPADVNCDGIINILDMILVGQHWTG